MAAGTETGQSFTACGTGFITEITVNFNSIITAGDATLKITTGTPAPITAPEYTQTVNIAAIGDLTIPLTTPFPVTNATQYSFSLLGIGATSVNMNFNGADVLAGGRFFQNTNAFGGGFDLRFSLSIAATDPNIPTLGQWGLIILGLLLVVCGIVAIRDRVVRVP